ncbi:MAG: MBL fold metallo-hydrolase [Micromonosporaceae bacterium]|nr:MBL fold metallo-hydrolase [Micromonosporaceae bacterium]
MAAVDPDSSWDQPGVFPVAPGVHRIPLPLPNDGLRAVNVYAIQDADGLVLVDAGWSLARSQGQLARCLSSLGYELGDVRRFLVTHIHRDHYTQAVALRRLFGSRIALGLGEQPGLDLLLSRPETIIPGRVAYLLGCGAAPVVAALAATSPGRTGDAVTDWEKPDEWLTAMPDAGLASRTLRVIPTPGHTQGHVVFLDAQQRLLFAGDHVLPHITPSIGFEAPVPRLPLADFLASLRLMFDYPDATLLPAHGPVAGSTHQRVRELLSHHAARLEACAAVLAEYGDSTAYEVALRLPWTRRNRAFADLNPFNQMLAVGETAAHLDVLVEDGRATKSTVAFVYRYQSS